MALLFSTPVLIPGCDWDYLASSEIIRVESMTTQGPKPMGKTSVPSDETHRGGHVVVSVNMVA